MKNTACFGLLAALLLPVASTQVMAAEKPAADTAQKTDNCRPPGPPPGDGKGPPPGKNGQANSKPPAPPSDGKGPPQGQPPPDDRKGPPPCPPPDGKGPPPPPKQAGSSAAPRGAPPGHSRAFMLAGNYDVSETVAKVESNQHYRSSKPDVSAIWVRHGGRLQLQQPHIEKSGDSSSHESSSFYGLNAALLITAGGTATIQGGHLRADGLGANAVSVIDPGSKAELSDTQIVAHGNGAHGVDAANGGSIVLRRVEIETFDASAAAVATDRGGGDIVVEGGKLVAHGYRSPGLYSTGNIKVAGVQVSATGAEAAVIEGSNSIEVDDSQLFAGKSWGAMLYQSFSGDAHGLHSRYSQRGGSFEAAEGPLFYVTNATGEIALNNVTLKSVSGVLVKASDGQWGITGHNGGHAVLHAVHQQLPGDLLADNGGSIVATLKQDSVLQGRVQGASLDIDASSRWDVRGDSHVAALTIAGDDAVSKLAHLQGNGHTVIYDANATANAWLGGKRWELPGGGSLQPGV